MTPRALLRVLRWTGEERAYFSVVGLLELLIELADAAEMTRAVQTDELIGEGGEPPGRAFRRDRYGNHARQTNFYGWAVVLLTTLAAGVLMTWPALARLFALRPVLAVWL